MPELTDIYNSQVGWNTPTWTSEWINISSSQTIVFSAFSTVDYDMIVNWSMDDNHDIVDTDTKSVLANQADELFLPVKTRFIQCSLTFVSNPVDFKTQFFFFLTNLGLQNLNNIGGYAELFKPYNELRTIQSSNGSVTVIQNADDIDLQAMTDVTTLTSAGGVNGIVVDGTGPSLSTKGLTSGTAIGLVSGANEITISNTSPATSVTLTSAGGTESLVVDGNGPTLSNKGLTAGTGITLLGSANDITISSSATFDPSYGSMIMDTFLQNGSGINFPVELDDPSTLGLANNFTNNGFGRMTYTGVDTKVFNILGTYSDAAGSVANYTSEVRINSVTLSAPGSVKRYRQSKAGSADPSNGVITLPDLVELSTGDYISIWVSNDTTNSISVDHISLIAIQVN
jgi:hypothetical protein